MANRILILDATGRALCALDGHHGAAHAADWTRIMLARLTAEGVDAMVVEITPEQGGDAMRRDVLGNLHRLRVELRQRPDGLRELVGLALYPHAAARPSSLAAVGVGQGLGKAQAAATPAAVRGALRVLTAPADITGLRHPIRIPRDRANPDPGQPRTPAEARQARRLARAQTRATR